VRNFRARNFLRDKVAAGDRVLFFHSSTAVPGIAGIAEVARAAYSDPDASDPRHPLFDAKHSVSAPRWYAVDLRHVRPMRSFVSLASLRAAAVTNAALGEMLLLRQPRLSVQPISEEQWDAIMRLEDTLAESGGGAAAKPRTKARAKGGRSRGTGEAVGAPDEDDNTAAAPGSRAAAAPPAAAAAVARPPATRSAESAVAGVGSKRKRAEMTR
jgi:predicted RNA-binding protein with PUA-like domain